MTQISQWQRQAAEYLEQERYREAIALYEQSISADPTVMSNYWHLGLALLLLGQESEAQVTWLSALAQGNPEQSDVQTSELVQVLAASAQRREAVFDLLNAWVIRQYICEFAPEDFNNLLASTLLSIDLELFSPHGKLALLQATQLVLTEKVTEVNLDLLQQVLEKLLDINPYHEFLETCLGSDALISDSQPWGEIASKVALAHNHLGTILYQKQSFYQAVNSFKKALEIKSNLPKSELAIMHFNVGMALAGEGKFEQAETHFQESLAQNPSFTQSRYQLSQVRYKAANILKGYQFTTDWFSWNIPIWEEYLARFVNVPEFNVLEIGSWEGRSTCWLLENILTHESAKITCIDTFEGSVEHKNYENDYLKSIEGRFDFNIARSGAPQKVHKIVGSSQKVMRSLPLNSYDIAYIDGSHLASDVLADAVLCWELVKVGGLIIFDDYNFFFPENPAQNTKIGIDAFITAFCDKIKLIHQGSQVIVEKTAC